MSPIQFYTFPQNSIDVWVFPRDVKQPDLIKPITMNLRMFSESPREIVVNTSDTTFSRYPIISVSELLTRDKPLGSVLKDYLTNSSRDFFDRLEQLTLTFSMVGLDWSHYSVRDIGECVFWTLTKTYINTEGGKLYCTINKDYSTCRKSDRVIYMEFFKPAIWMALLVCVLSIVALFLDVKAMISRIMIFKKIRDLETIKNGTTT